MLFLLIDVIYSYPLFLGESCPTESVTLCRASSKKRELEHWHMIGITYCFNHNVLWCLSFHVVRSYWRGLNTLFSQLLYMKIKSFKNVLVFSRFCHPNSFSYPGLYVYYHLANWNVHAFVRRVHLTTAVLSCNSGCDIFSNWGFRNWLLVDMSNSWVGDVIM